MHLTDCLYSPTFRLDTKLLPAAIARVKKSYKSNMYGAPFNRMHRLFVWARILTV